MCHVWKKRMEAAAWMRKPRRGEMPKTEEEAVLQPMRGNSFGLGIGTDSVDEAHDERVSCSCKGGPEDGDAALGHAAGDEGDGETEDNAVSLPDNSWVEEMATTLLLLLNGRAHRDTTRALARP